MVGRTRWSIWETSALFASSLLLVLAAPCGGPDKASQLADEMLVRRPHYDTSRSWQDLVKPHFFARAESGEAVAIEGDPELIVERHGALKVRLAVGEGEQRYVDLLALESERIGEHPVHKVFRLSAMGVQAQGGLLARLQPSNFDDDLFHTVSFQYLPGRDASGVIAEVFPDGTFLVIPFGTQPEWQSDRGDVESPSHLHVDPRAMSVGDSELAAEYEAEILALPFDDQRYPPAPLAKKRCDVYAESLRGVAYADALASVGYDFTPEHVAPEAPQPTSFGERATRILRQGSGTGVSYFGFDPSWIGRLLVELRAPWVRECDAAYGLRSRPSRGDAGVAYYAVVRHSLEPDRRDRYKIVDVADDGSSQVLYDATGVVLMAVPLPSDPGQWLMSMEGWPAPKNGTPADPRWQSVYLVDVNAPERYSIVEYPISQYPRAPEQGLYGSSPLLSDDSRYLINNLYGFEDEGGGLWVVDLASPEFYKEDTAFSRIVPWDHALSWLVLGSADLGAGGTLSVLLTAKEVGNDTAMTANLLRISRTGLDSRVESRRRLLRMVGWNPVPMAVQRLSGQEFWVAVETHFNYESSLLPRARGVYMMLVDTEARE